VIEAIAKLIRAGTDATTTLRGLNLEARKAVEIVGELGPPLPFTPTGGGGGGPPRAWFSSFRPRPLFSEAAFAPAIARARGRGVGLSDEELAAALAQKQQRYATMVQDVEAFARGKGGAANAGLRDKLISVSPDIQKARSEVETLQAESERRGVTAASRDVTAEKRASLVTDRDLAREWQRQQQLLRQQRETIDQVGQAYHRLTERKRQGLPVDESEIRATETRLGQLHAGRSESLQAIREIETEARRVRGLGAAELRAMGGAGGAAAGGGGAGFFETFLGGAASMGGIGALARLAGPAALAGGVLLAAHKAVAITQDTFSTRVKAHLQALPTSLIAGGDPLARERDATATGGRYGISPIELLAAEHALAQSTGIGQAQRIAAVARLTGQDSGTEAAAIAGLMRLAPTRGGGPDILSDRAFGAFTRSRFGTPGQPFLYPSYQQALAQVQAGAASPFTRVPLEGVMGQLNAMSRIHVPGVERGTAGFLDIQTARLQGLNQFTAGMGDQTGPLADIAYNAVRQMRGTPAGERLRRLGIDISTPLGILRAIRRAPELAARHMPDVAEGLQRAFSDAYPDRAVRELVAFNATGDTEAAAFIAGGRGAQVYRARPETKGAPGLETAAEAVAGTPAARSITAETVQKELTELRSEGSAQVGEAITTLANEVRSGWTSLLDALPRVIDDALHLQVGGPGANESRAP